MKAIFIVTGLPKTGKSTCIKTITPLFTQPHGLSYDKIIDEKMKCIGPKFPTKRQTYYINKIRELLLHSSIITNYIIDRIKKASIIDNAIFFIECHNPKDIILIRRAFPRKVKVIYINRKVRWESAYFTPDDFVYDYVINNISTRTQFTENIYEFIRTNIIKKFKIKSALDEISFKIEKK